MLLQPLHARPLVDLVEGAPHRVLAHPFNMDAPRKSISHNRLGRYRLHYRLLSQRSPGKFSRFASLEEQVAPARSGRLEAHPISVIVVVRRESRSAGSD